MMERDRAAQLVHSWDLNADAWTTSVRGGQIESRRVATDRAIISAVQSLAPRSVLDIGCGEGWLCRVLASCGVSVAGVDGAESLVRAARAADPAGRYVRLHYDEFADLVDTAGSGFDVAVFNFSLFDEAVHTVLARTMAAVRPGGAIVIQTLDQREDDRDGWRTETFACSDTIFPAPMPWYSRSRESWLEILGELPLEVSRLTSIRHPDTGRPLSLMIVAKRM